MLCGFTSTLFRVLELKRTVLELYRKGTDKGEIITQISREGLEKAMRKPGIQMRANVSVYVNNIIKLEQKYKQEEQCWCWFVSAYYCM